MDGLSDDTKMETQRDIHQRATDELAEAELETQIHLTFYLVSQQLPFREMTLPACLLSSEYLMRSLLKNSTMEKL